MGNADKLHKPLCSKPRTWAVLGLHRDDGKQNGKDYLVFRASQLTTHDMNLTGHCVL